MKTLIIDNYDSFTYNLYQYLGSLGGNPIVARNDQITFAQIQKAKFSHIVISPGPGSPDDPVYFGIGKEVILKLGSTTPILGVCLGHQGIISAFVGKVVAAITVRHCKKSLIKHNNQGIFRQVKNPIFGMRYHSLMGEKSSLPSVLEITAVSDDDTVIMGVKHQSYPIYGVQFHPESVGTEEGEKILRNFLSIEVGPPGGPTS